MKTVVIFLLCATVTLRALAAPAEEAPEQVVQVKEELKPQENAEGELPPLAPEVRSHLCPPLWEFYSSCCYFLNNNYLTRKDAVRFCANFEATLISVHSPMENNYFQHMASTAGHSTAWTGGYFFEGDWWWHDGSDFDFNNLGNFGSATTKYNKCVRMNTEGNTGWFNTDCSSIAPSICQIKVNC